MQRFLFLVLALLVLSAQARAADLVAQAGSVGEHIAVMQPGSVGYADFTANGVVWTDISHCGSGGAVVQFISNIASASDHDATAKAHACPAKTNTASATLCRAHIYPDATGTVTDTLTGDNSTTVGRWEMKDVTGPNLVVAVTTASQTSRVTIICPR